MTDNLTWWQNFFSGPVLDMWKAAVTEEQTRSEAKFLLEEFGLDAGAKLLDVPSGHTGRLSFQLAAAGYLVTGVDIAEGFPENLSNEIDSAGLSVEFHSQDMRHLAWHEQFDGAFSFGNSFGYFDDDGNRDFLKSVARALKPGARFILDTGLTGESLFPHFQPMAWYQLGDMKFLASRRFVPATGRIEIEYTFIRDGKEEMRPSSQRVYLCSELCRMVTNVGFAVNSMYGSLDRQQFELGSHRLLLVCVKT